MSSVYFLFLVLLVSFVAADNSTVPPLTISRANKGATSLAPVCNGGAVTKVLTKDDHNIKLSSVSKTSGVAAIGIECFSFLRVPTVNTQECLDAATAVKVNLKVNGDSPSDTMTIPLHLVYGGSITSTSYYYPYRVGFDLVAEVDPTFHWPAGCNVNFSFSMYFVLQVPRRNRVPEVIPRLREITPFVALKGHETFFTFLAPPQRTATTDRFFIASRYVGCDQSQATSTISSGVSGPLVENGTSRRIDWSIAFPNQGAYYVCIIPAGSSTAWAVAYVNVFGGNPAYFTVLEAPDSTRWYFNTWYTFQFSGIKLDLRPGKDEAKIIDGSNDCSTGRMLSGVETESPTNLGPDDSYGDNVTVARLRVYFRWVSGYVRICYKRYGHEWVEVQFLAISGPHARDTLTNLTNLAEYHADETFAPEAGGTPTPSSTGSPSTTTGAFLTFTPAPTVIGKTSAPQACSEENPDFTYDKTRVGPVKVVLKVSDSKSVNSDLLAALSNYLCIDSQLLLIGVPQEVKDGDEDDHGYTVTVESICTTQCNNDRKMQYLEWLVNQGASTTEGAALRRVGTITQASTETNEYQVYESGNNKNGNKVANVVNIVVPILVVALVLVLGVGGYVLHKSRQRTEDDLWRVSPEAGAEEPYGGSTPTHSAWEATEIEVIEKKPEPAV